MLSGGLWEGLSAVRKGANIHIKVGAWLYGQKQAMLMIDTGQACFPIHKMQLLQPGDKVCLGLDRLTCGQCMCDQKKCFTMVVESKLPAQYCSWISPS